MHALGKGLGHDLPTGRAALQRFELARIAQMQPRTSFFRFVREHLMGHAERRRENFPVESGLLPHATARGIHRALLACHQRTFFQRAGLQPFAYQANDARVADPVLQELGQPLVADLVEEALDVGVHDPAHIGARDAYR